MTVLLLSQINQSLVLQEFLRRLIFSMGSIKPIKMKKNLHSLKGENQNNPSSD